MFIWLLWRTLLFWATLVKSSRYLLIQQNEHSAIELKKNQILKKINNCLSLQKKDKKRSATVTGFQLKFNVLLFHISQDT